MTASFNSIAQRKSIIHSFIHNNYDNNDHILIILKYFVEERGREKDRDKVMQSVFLIWQDQIKLGSTVIFFANKGHNSYSKHSG